MSIFGKDLQAVPCIFVSQSIGNVPKFLVEASEYLLQHLDTLGLFRKSASAIKLRDLKMRIDRGCSFESEDPIHVACLIKIFLHELPEPLATFHSYNSFISIIKNMSKNSDNGILLLSKDTLNYTYHAQTSNNNKKSTNKVCRNNSFRQNKYFANTSLKMNLNELDNEKIIFNDLCNNKDALAASFADVMMQLPPLHLSTFIYLLDLLASIASRSDRNRMTEANLGICLAPAIFRQQESDITHRTRSTAMHVADIECEKLAIDALTVEILIMCAVSIRRQISINRAQLCKSDQQLFIHKPYKSKENVAQKQKLPTIYSGVNLLDTSAIEIVDDLENEDIGFSHHLDDFHQHNLSIYDNSLALNTRKRKKPEDVSISSYSNINKKRNFIKQIGDRLFTPKKSTNTSLIKNIDASYLKNSDISLLHNTPTLTPNTIRDKKLNLRRSIRGFFSNIVGQKKPMEETYISSCNSLLEVAEENSIISKHVKKTNKSFDDRKKHKMFKSIKWRNQCSNKNYQINVLDFECALIKKLQDENKENDSTNLKNHFKKKQTKSENNSMKYKSTKNLLLHNDSTHQLLSFTSRTHSKISLNNENSPIDDVSSQSNLSLHQQCCILTAENIVNLSNCKNNSSETCDDEVCKIESESFFEADADSDLLDCALSGSILDLEVCEQNENLLNERTFQVTKIATQLLKTDDGEVKESCDSLDSGVSMTVPNMARSNHDISYKLSRNIASESHLMDSKTRQNSYNFRKKEMGKSVPMFLSNHDAKSL